VGFQSFNNEVFLRIFTVNFKFTKSEV
jgi:hypothetical protein